MIDRSTGDVMGAGYRLARVTGTGMGIGWKDEE